MPVTGPSNPACLEAVERMDKKLMPPRPEWNAMGPYVSKRWRARLKKINSRLVLQYFPYAQLPGTTMTGFWAICLKMPRTKLLYKQSVMSLIDQFGRFSPPSMGLLASIKRGMWKVKHEGIMSEIDALDRKLDAADQKKEARQKEGLYESIMQSLGKLKIKSMGTRIYVP